MNRRTFIKALGAGAAAVTLAGDLSSLHAEAATQDVFVSEGWASTTLQAGDVFTIAGRYEVHPVTGMETGFLQQFMVTQTVTADSGDEEVSIHPRIDMSSIVKARQVNLLGTWA